MMPCAANASQPLSTARGGRSRLSRSSFSPSARAGQVDLPVSEMPSQFRPRGSPGTRGAA
jgi:hypothetical protein